MLCFKCNHCGTTLRVLPNSDVSSGPCPHCSAWIDLEKSEIRWLPSQPPHTLERRSHKRQNTRIRPDNIFDQSYNDKRDTFGTLKVLITAFVVGAIILAITYYMKRWGAR